MATIYRVRKTWNDASSQKGAFASLDNAKKCADQYKYNVYGDNGKLVYSTATTTETLYRVRKTWADEKSQVGAYKTLANAKTQCNKYPGYSVYDANGKAVYTSPVKTQSYADIVAPIVTACKEQTKWAYGSTYKWEAKPTVAKSKTHGTCVTYVACVLQRAGIINSGEYIWHNGKGYGTGKVTGAVKSWMEVIYPNNKTAKAIKSQLKLGDVILHDDNKSGKVGDGGHIEIYGGAFNTAGTKAKFFSVFRCISAAPN